MTFAAVVVLVVLSQASPKVPPPTGEQPAPAAPARTDAGRRFLADKLAELDSFKSLKRFHEFGFADRGYSAWQKSVEAKRDDKSFSFLERVSCGDLAVLGLEYQKTGGRESRHTRWARGEIGAVIGPPAPGPEARAKAAVALNFARNLERSGKVAAALRAYGAVTRDFKGTQEAADAAARVKALRPE